MKYIKLYCLFVFFVVSLITLSANLTIIYADANKSYSINTSYEKNNAKFVYFDISENNLCISYDNDKIYEYSKNGQFIRIISYHSSGNIYSYYKNNNLVIFDLRKNIHIVLDNNGNCIEKFESNYPISGYYVGADFSDNINLEEHGLSYKYINSNWFSRVFQGKKSSITIMSDNNVILYIEENYTLVEELVPIFILTIISVVLVVFCFVKKKYSLAKMR